jgi:hypothetical protein
MSDCNEKTFYDGGDPLVSLRFDWEHRQVNVEVNGPLFGEQAKRLADSLTWFAEQSYLESGLGG